ncbi:MAG: tRNA (N6-isopentenyl adenosine(37)-C2)-methylthiotransferase MiaB [Desulfamplus sp.]|nr:tRNA (N6-isopentenyl adenosine(37)-C2)-methylthiotransferase MiaB [Desulfamplus sp.]
MNYKIDGDYIDHINYGDSGNINIDYPSHKGYAYVYTIGCQMNSYDSEKIYAIIGSLGYARTDRLEKADIVVCNTCSIREKAQEKAFSFLGTVVGKKRKKADLISIMAGCVAQQEGKNIFKRIPDLDIVMGTQAFSRLPDLIAMAKSGRKHIADIKEPNEIFESMPDFTTLDRGKISKFVTIMQGCNNFCTYCVVPHVRGRERSRTPENIVEEITILADSGVKEVTLLGQNVNSYGDYGDKNRIGSNEPHQQGVGTFPELLEKINKIEGIERIRFATSHPKDISDELIFAIRDLKKVCNQLHLPVQSGSNAILKKMNRGYTRESYLERIATLRTHCSGIGISSDIIVGFPSESREDFEQTLDLIRTVEFDGLFAFSYSDRPNAPASKFSGALPEKEKMDRLNELLALQEYYTQKKNRSLVGTVEPVLVEGRSLKRRHADAGLPSSENHKTISKTDNSQISFCDTQEQSKHDQHDSDIQQLPYSSLQQMTGRTESGKIIHFYSDIVQPGQIVNIHIEEAYPHSLWGSVIKNS